MPTEVFEVRAVGKDEVTAELKRVQRAMGKLEKDLKANEAAAKGVRGAFSRMTSGVNKLTGVVRTMQAAFAASLVVDFGKQLFDAGKQGAVVADQFQILQGRIKDFPVLMDQAREATANMIPDQQLQKSIALFDSFDIPLERIPEALEQVAKTAMRTGEDASFLANSLSLGIARISPKIIDNLGIQIKLSQVTEAAAQQFGKQAKEVTDLEKKTALLNLVLDNLAQKNKDIEFLEQRTAIFNQLETAVENAKTSLGAFIADTLNAYAYIIGPASTATEELAAALTLVSSFQHTMEGSGGDGIDNSLSNLVFGITETSAALEQQSEAARAAGAALRRIPVAQRKDAFDRLMATFENIPHGLRIMIRDLGGVDAALKSAATTAESAGYTMAQFRADLDDYRGFVVSGGAPASIRDLSLRKKPKRRGGGGGRRKALIEEIEKAERLARLMEAQPGAERIRLEFQQKSADLDKKAAEMLKARIDKGRVEAFLSEQRLKLELDEADALDEIEIEAGKIAAANEARARSLQRVNEQLEIGRIMKAAELRMVTATDPLLRAELELQIQKARIMGEMRSINENEEGAVLRRAEAQHQLNMAMAHYAATVKDIELAKFTEQMGRASSIASSAAGELSTMHEGLGKAMDTAGASVKAITKNYKAYEKGQIGVGQAVVGATAGIGAAVAGQIEDERARAGVLAAIEAAMSAAAFARLDIPAGIAHLAASGMFTAVAAGAGGSSSSGGGGGGGGSAAAAAAAAEQEQRGGFGEDTGRQVIVQFGSGVILGDPQSVASAVNQATYSARGTGHAMGY